MQLEDLCCHPERSDTLLLSRHTALIEGGEEEHLPLPNNHAPPSTSTPSIARPLHHPPPSLPWNVSGSDSNIQPYLGICDELSEYATGIPDLRIKETKGLKYKDLSNRRLHQMMVRKSRSLKDDWDELPLQEKQESRSWVERYVAPVTRTYEASTDDKTTTIESRRAAVHSSRTLWDALVGSQVATQHINNTRGSSHHRHEAVRTTSMDSNTIRHHTPQPQPRGGQKGGEQLLYGPSSPSPSPSKSRSPNNQPPQQKVVVDAGVDKYLAALLRSCNPTEETLTEAALTVKKQRGNGEGALSAHTIRAFNALSPETSTRKSRLAAELAEGSYHQGVFKAKRGPTKSLIKKGGMDVSGLDVSIGRNQRPTPGAMSKSDIDEMCALFHGDVLDDDLIGGNTTTPVTQHMVRSSAPDSVLGITNSPQPQSRLLAPLPSNSPIALKYAPPRCTPQTPHECPTNAAVGELITSSIAEEVNRLVNDPRPFVDWRPEAMRISTVFAYRLQRLLYLKHHNVLTGLDTHIRDIKRISAQEVFGSCICDTSIVGLFGTPGSLEFILRHEIIKVSMLHGAHEDGVILGTRASSTSHNVVRIPLAIHAAHISEEVIYHKRNKPSQLPIPSAANASCHHQTADGVLMCCKVPPILETQLTSILLRPVQVAIHDLFDGCCRGVSTASRHRAHPHLSPLLVSSISRRIYKMVFLHYAEEDILDLISLEMPTIFYEHSSTSLWNISRGDGGAAVVNDDRTTPFQHLMSIKMTRNEFVRWMSLLMVGWCERGTIAECLLVLRTVRFLWQDLLFQPLDHTLLHHLQSRLNEHQKCSIRGTLPLSSRSSLVPLLPPSALSSLQALLLFTTQEVARSLTARFRITTTTSINEASMASSTEEVLSSSRHQRLLQAVLHASPCPLTFQQQQQQQLSEAQSIHRRDEDEMRKDVDRDNHDASFASSAPLAKSCEAHQNDNVTPPTKNGKAKQLSRGGKKGGVYGLRRRIPDSNGDDVAPTREVYPLGIRQAVIPPTNHGDLMLAKWLMKRLPPVTTVNSRITETSDMPTSPSPTPQRLPPISLTGNAPHEADNATYRDQRRTISTPLVDAVRQRSLHYNRFSKYALEARGTYSLQQDE